MNHLGRVRHLLDGNGNVMMIQRHGIPAFLQLSSQIFEVMNQESTYDMGFCILTI
ncbi:hypothetical protein F511_32764 [Dorcoceras hygrometricum]|uniref:Uncharacterized protein n=1 Tax=Dorcoceras hygrometricum TaxID=472368 RepID=A0A2Z7AFJ9_9LAMI|nr:hypothetical protein F511_32764 [Dorcoceras hygrometricum]